MKYVLRHVREKNYPSPEKLDCLDRRCVQRLSLPVCSLKAVDSFTFTGG